jgi:hypothetical protein
VTDLAYAVDFEISLENALYHGTLFAIALDANREPFRLGLLGQMIVIGGRGNRQLFADRFDPKFSR